MPTPKKAHRPPPKLAEASTPALGSKIRYPLPEASAMLGISLSLLYQRIEQGAVQATRDGRRRYMTDSEIRRYGEQSH